MCSDPQNFQISHSNMTCFFNHCALGTLDSLIFSKHSNPVPVSRLILLQISTSLAAIVPSYLNLYIPLS